MPSAPDVLAQAVLLVLGEHPEDRLAHPLERPLVLDRGLLGRERADPVEDRLEVGVGLARGVSALDLRVIGQILASWFVTLPAGGALAAEAGRIRKTMTLRSGPPPVDGARRTSCVVGSSLNSPM